MTTRTHAPDGRAGATSPAGDGGWADAAGVAGAGAALPGLHGQRAETAVVSGLARVGGRWLLGAAGALLLLAGLLAGVGGGLVPPQLGPSLRLRVVGASNAPADQQVKLAVRDAVLQQIAPALAHAQTVAQATADVRARLGAVRRVAAAVAARFGERARVRLGPAPFPVERIGWLAFPAGRYPALAIYLGAARGHNWWTVLFPPLAFVTVGGRLDVVGPTERAQPADGGILTAWTRTAVLAHGSGGLVGTRVQVRFALWELMRALKRRAPLWWRAWAQEVAHT